MQPITDIYHEHIEEASFLYDQRNNLLSEPDGDLEYQSRTEERLEAHIDGLELGGEYSKPILKKYIDSEKEGEFFTAVYSLLRMGEDERNEVMEILETDPIPCPAALCNVFRFFDSENLNERLSNWLTSDSPVQKAVAAEVLGYKRYSKALPHIERLLTDNDITVKTAALKAINRLDPKLGRNIAYHTLIDGNPDTSFLDACFENLFIQQEKTVFQIARQYCEGKYPFHPAAPIIPGLNAGPDDLQLLFTMLKAANIDRSVFQAIGFTGRIDLLERLIPLEDNPEYKPLIQEASHLIIGTDPPELEDEFEDEDEDEEDKEEVTNNPENSRDQEKKDDFSLTEKLSTINIPKTKWQERYRLGKPVTKENETEILTNIAAMYRRWLYPDMCYKEGKKIIIDHDDPAERQYRLLKGRPE